MLLRQEQSTQTQTHLLNPFCEAHDLSAPSSLDTASPSEPEFPLGLQQTGHVVQPPLSPELKLKKTFGNGIKMNLMSHSSKISPSTR